MNIDTALRYEPVVKELKKVNPKGLPLLEVGSGINGITDFYKGKVFGVDSDFSRIKEQKNKNIIHKKGSIIKIPFKDNSFSYVVCLDTFEHLPKEKRKTAFKELLRVVKDSGYILAGFPEGNASKNAEKIINNLFKAVQGRYHPWLSEHQEYGLPQKLEIKKYLKELSIKSYEVRPNVNIFIWVIMHFLYTVFDSRKTADRFSFLKPVLFSLGKNLKLPPFYRSIYIIKALKNEADKISYSHNGKK
jgi:ubiquinone/menaquinone biosynthesis C-methylase UbiE